MRRLYILLPLLLLGTACLQDPEAPHNQPDTPTLSVDETSVTRVSMLVNGSFGHDLTDITSYGVELSETLFDSGSDYKTLVPQEVSGNGFSLGITDLKSNSVYYLRAFISNGHSRMYSPVVTQKTPETSVVSVSDVTLSSDGTLLTASIEDNGGRNIEDFGFAWGETNDRKALRREKRYPGTPSSDGLSFTLPVAHVGKGTHYVIAYVEDDQYGVGFSRIPYERIVKEDEPLQPGYSSYLTFSTDGTSSISFSPAENATPVLYYSTDKTHWNLWDYSTLTFSKKNPLYICGDNPNGLGTVREDIHSSFSSSGDLYAISGSIMSLLNGYGEITAIPTEYCFARLFSGCTNMSSAPTLPAMELADWCYGYLFENCSSLLAAPELPATVMAKACYADMFLSCTSITTPPELPSTTLADTCYGLMFSDCTGLLTAPALPATVLAPSCYIGMFYNCSSLTAAPVLNAPVLADYCYRLMFAGCTSLTSITCLATDISAENCTLQWLLNASPTGTFTKSPEMNDWPSGISGIPEGWTVINDGGTPISASNYLTFTTEGNTTISLTSFGQSTPVLYYSTDATNWALWDYSELPISKNAPLYLCGDNPDGFNKDINNYRYFNTSGDPFSVSGDIMSLINNQESVSVIPQEGCFRGLFLGTNIVSPPSLPATTLAYGCYYQMFYACPNLATAPELPATTMAEGCYWEMFRNCTSLTTPPTLPATSMEGGCYRDMFYGCSSLNTAPELPATKLAGNCYNAMFYGCSSLTSPPELPASIMEKGCYANMFYGCSSLASAPDLPSTSLAEDCYASMFSGCSLLTSAPSVLPATTLAPRCYSDMFYDCINLAKAPEISATTMAEYSCRRMFQNCSRLTEAPKLPVAVLAEGCYLDMFFRCERLSYVQCLATDIGASSCVNQWLVGVASQGTFVKAASMNDWPSGGSGIPEGWTVINDGDTPSGGNEGTGNEDWN